jgi:hypothetical protein
VWFIALRSNRFGATPFGAFIARTLHEVLFMLFREHPRQDSALRPQDYQSVVFDGSPWSSLADAAQRFSLSQRCQPFSVILADFWS